MSRYQYCLRVVLNHEGGISNHKADRGGLTAYGVTQKTYDDFCKLTGREKKPVTEITPEEVETIYGGYWKDAHCAVLPEPLDLAMLDLAINSGVTRAIKLLQRALGVAEDGVYGRQTALAIQEEITAGGVDELCSQLLDEREDFYHRIVDNDPSQKVFLRGWLSRLDKLEEECGLVSRGLGVRSIQV